MNTKSKTVSIIIFIIACVLYGIFFQHIYKSTEISRTRYPLVSRILLFLFFILIVYHLSMLYKYLRKYKKNKDKDKSTKNHNSLLGSEGYSCSRCQGGAYMYQGDSFESQVCRQMASTQEGRDEINKSKCPCNQIGGKKNSFEYTPITAKTFSSGCSV
jgi:hypothetical protein